MSPGASVVSAARVAGAGQEAQRHAGGTQLLGLAAGAHQDGRVVAGVGVAQPAAGGVQHGEEGGGKLLRRRPPVEEAREADADLVRRQSVLDRSGGEGLERGGEQRGGHALAGDVGDHQHQLAIVCPRHHLVVVAGHHPRRKVGAVELPARDRRQLARQQGHLNAAGERQLLLQAPTLLGLQHQPQVAQVERRDRRERHQQLQILLRELAHVQAGFEDDHAQRPLRAEQRRGDEAAHAGEEDARRLGEAHVGQRVEHQGRHVLLGDLAHQAAGEAHLGDVAGGGADGGGLQLAALVLEQDGAAVRPQVLQHAFEDQPQQPLQRQRLAQRLVDLVEQLQPLRVAPQAGLALRLRGVRRALAVEHLGGVPEDRTVLQEVVDLGDARRRRRLLHERQHAVADLDGVADRHGRRLHHLLAVEQRAVARAEILHIEGRADAVEARVPAGEEGVGERQVGVGGAADDQRIPLEGMVERQALRGDDVELQHGGVILARRLSSQPSPASRNCRLTTP